MGEHTISASVTDSGGLTDSAMATVTVAVTGCCVSVETIGYSTLGGRLSDKHLMVVMTIVDDNNVILGNASVSVTIMGPDPTSLTGTESTDALGQASFRINNAPSGAYTTTVTDVTATGLTWDNTFPANSFAK